MNNKKQLLGLECLNCALKTVTDIVKLTDISREKQIELMQMVIDRLSKEGVDRNNCVIIEETYRMATEYIGADDPYISIKAHYNRGMMNAIPQMRALVDKSKNPVVQALHMSIIGNLIDLAAQGLDVSLKRTIDKITNDSDDALDIDDTAALGEALKNAKSLLVIGDNCGEIALDKLLLETIHRAYPQLRLIYGVRGSSTVNDVTLEDAKMVRMHEVAEVIDNGDSLLTTALDRTSEAFNKEFYGADVIISKGMGNYEGLYDCDRGNIWFLMIVKCDVVARMTDMSKGSVLCMQKK